MALTPESDSSLEQLAIYLRDGLNAVEPGAVGAIFAYDCVPQDPSQYPALILYRIESQGEDLHRCRASIRYAVFGQDDRSRRPGLFRWVELAIASLLKQYADSYTTPAVRLGNLDELRSRYRIAQAQSLIPFIEIEFEFVDWITL